MKSAEKLWSQIMAGTRTGAVAMKPPPGQRERVETDRIDSRPQLRTTSLYAPFRPIATFWAEFLPPGDTRNWEKRCILISLRVSTA
jgi:hypothetical protein